MLLHRDYGPHEALVAPARERSQVWRLVIGLIIAAGVYLLCNQFLFRNLFAFLGEAGPSFFDALDSGSTPFAMLVLLGSFGFMIVGVAVAVRVAHQRGILGVIGDLRLTFSQFFDVLIVLVVINLAIWALPPWSWGEEGFVPNMDFSAWMILLPFSITAILIQVSAEEILFRGYIQQQLAARFASPLIWMLIPSLLFGAGHYLPEEAGENAVMIALWAVVFGVLMADLTARAGTLGPAIATHLVNNLSAILIVSLPDELSGLSLFLAPFSMSDTAEIRAWLPVDFAAMIVAWLGARLALRR
jgi:membrane protease YdiL (CAAX protease family)